MEKKILVEDVRENETRVAVLHDGILEDCLVETNDRSSLKGNIYLAKVVRIEPALQAAFMDYGDKQHGFLPFNEIHPDYFRIPVEDREVSSLSDSYDENAQENGTEDKYDKYDKYNESLSSDDEENDDIVDESNNSEPRKDNYSHRSNGESTRRKYSHYKKYKIQEVIRKNQVILVQITKERRVHKGVTLSTFICLASRYCVFMANTTRGGGVSRKIGTSRERQLLKNFLEEINLPEGQGLIVRTAGVNLTTDELKNEYDKLAGAWNDIREKTMESIAPKLIREEAGLAKRLVRDFYDHNVTEIIISGDKFYKEVKEHMGLIVPSHKRRVKKYKEEEPLFYNYGVKDDLDSIYDHKVLLPSGGHIVLNPTEALVSIDVNSGKFTRERSIGETALATNLEAADEIARQLRLRDISGLIVIDFIDMEDYSHRRKIEDKFRQATNSDRARLQIGEISNFGLLEMSRQRIRSSMNELFMEKCGHCKGGGYVMSSIVKLRKMLQEIEDYLVKSGKEKIKQLDTVPTLTLRVVRGFAVDFLNSYRRDVSALEDVYGVMIRLEEFDVSSTEPWKIELSPDGELSKIRPLSVHNHKIPKKTIEAISRGRHKERDYSKRDGAKPSKRKQIRDRAKPPREFKSSKNEENINDLIDDHYQSLEESFANESKPDDYASGKKIGQDDVIVKKSDKRKESRSEKTRSEKTLTALTEDSKADTVKNSLKDDYVYDPKSSDEHTHDRDTNILSDIRSSSEDSESKILVEPSDYQPKTKTLRKFIGNRSRVESKASGASETDDKSSGFVSNRLGLVESGDSETDDKTDRVKKSLGSDKQGRSSGSHSEDVKTTKSPENTPENTIEIIIPPMDSSKSPKKAKKKPLRKSKSSRALQEAIEGGFDGKPSSQDGEQYESSQEIVINTGLLDVSLKSSLGKSKKARKVSDQETDNSISDLRGAIEPDENMTE